MTALEPKLTRLDERVLRLVPEEGCVRARDVAHGTWQPGQRTHQPGGSRTPAYERHCEEILGILRGLRHLGYVRYRRGGWWTR